VAEQDHEQGGGQQEVRGQQAPAHDESPAHAPDNYARAGTPEKHGPVAVSTEVTDAQELPSTVEAEQSWQSSAASEGKDWDQDQVLGQHPVQGEQTHEPGAPALLATTSTGEAAAAVAASAGDGGVSRPSASPSAEAATTQAQTAAPSGTEEAAPEEGATTA
jgi:hypothetical protein